MLENIYRVIEDTYICGNNRVVLYGISVFSEETKDMLAIHCLSENYNAVNELCGLCNYLQLDPVHLGDVTEDFLFAMRAKNGKEER